MAQTLSTFAALFTLLTASMAHAQPPNGSELATNLSRQLDAYHRDAKAPQDPLRVVYFHPSDVAPQANHQQRMSRIMLDVQDFYRSEMQRLGFGPRTFTLELVKDNLQMHDVIGEDKSDGYTHDSGSKVRNRIFSQLRTEMNMNQQFVLSINAMCTKREDGSYYFYAPYYGSGGSRSGLCHAADCELMDTLLFEENDKRIKYTEHYGTRDQSQADFSCLYIGGIAHELGHAFGIPHNRQKPWEKAEYGTALMGSGNFTYRHEKRGRKGSFLTFANAVQLASHPLFTGSRHNLDLDVSCSLPDLSFEQNKQTLRVLGTIETNVDAYAVVAYTNPEIHMGWQNEDYDALTWISPVVDGKFEIKARVHSVGKSGLKLRVCHLNGVRSDFKFEYAVNERREPQADALNSQWRIQQVEQAYLAGDKDKAARLARKNLPKLSDETTKAKLSHLLELVSPKSPRPPSEVTEDEIALSQLVWKSAKVGWGKPARDQYHIDRNNQDAVFLESTESFFQRGLYAHAPSRYVFEIGGKWKRFKATAALQKGVGGGGSGIFQVKADGKTLFKSKRLEGKQTQTTDVDVEGVSILELIVESGKPGNGMCWTIWGDAKLTR
ncbi:MAG: NPCBM/NEW2 domain-containing protein [Rubripirellula sp.]